MTFPKTLDLCDNLVNRIPVLKIVGKLSNKIIRLKVISISNGIVLFNQINGSNTDDFFVIVNNIHHKISEEIGFIENLESFYKIMKDCSIEQDLINYQNEYYN